MLNALNQYYHCLCKQKDTPITPEGYSKVAVNFNMVLTKDGELKEILPYVHKGNPESKNKKLAKDSHREEIFPFRNSIAGIASETIDHREKYLFGVEFDKNQNKFVLGKNSVSAFEKCKEKTFEFFAKTEKRSPVIESYLLFLEKWIPEEQLDNKILQDIAKDFMGAKFVISLDGEEGFLHNNYIVKELWDENFKTNQVKSDIIGQCSVSGKENAEIARIHTKLKGVLGGNATGTGLVSFNNTAFESYGKSQSYNSSVSKEVMDNYTQAFNFLTSSKKHNKMLDDITLLFWAMTDKNETPFVETFTNVMGFGNNAEDMAQVEVNNADDSLHSIFHSAVKGINSDIESFADYQNVQFYILGIKPNSSRLAVKIFCHNTFGTFMKNLNQHHLDMQLCENDKQISIWVIKEQLKSPISKKELPPDLSAKIFQSILMNTPYPRFLLDTVVYRVKTDQDDGKKFKSVNRTRVRIIKAVLSRLNKIKREDYTMLNKENKDEAYNCGRLFATLEMIQRRALGDSVNATIKDRFFASACSTPHLVFPRLIKLTQNHLGKIESGLNVYYEQILTEVIGNLKDSFPKSFNMEKQGIFIMGYYQQKESFYTKKTNEKEGE